MSSQNATRKISLCLREISQTNEFIEFLKELKVKVLEFPAHHPVLFTIDATEEQITLVRLKFHTDVFRKI